MFFDLGENNATFKTNIMQKFDWFLVNNRFSLSVLLKGVLLGQPFHYEFAWRILYQKKIERERIFKRTFDLKCIARSIFMCFFSEKCMLLLTTIRVKSHLFHSRQLLLLTLSVITGNRNTLLLLLSLLLTGTNVDKKE